MQKTITITAANRPALLQGMLQSLVRNELDGWTIFVSIEPTSVAPDLVSICKTTLAGHGCEIAINDKVLGIRDNPHNAISRVFAAGSALNLHLEEDLLVSPDVTALSSWYAEHHEPSWLCLNLLAGPCGSGALLSDSRFPGELFLARTFNSLGFAVRREEWQSLMAPSWFGAGVPELAHKLPRNIPLLKTYVRQNPDRVYCWWHLGDMLEMTGDDDGAAHAWRKGIEVARSQIHQAYPLSHSLPFISLIMLQLDLDCLEEDLFDEALELFPEQLYLQWVRCQLALERGEGESVRAKLEELASIDADTFYDPRIAYDKTLFKHLCRESLALCHFRAGRFDEAAHWCRRAAPAAPDRRACEIKAELALAKVAVNSS